MNYMRVVASLYEFKENANIAPKIRGSRSSQQAAALLDEIHEHEVAERLRRGKERSTTIEFGHSLHKVLKSRIGIEHERVDPNTFFGAAAYLQQRGVHRGADWRVVKLRLAKLIEMGSGLPVSDHDDLFRP